MVYMFICFFFINCSFFFPYCCVFFFLFKALHLFFAQVRKRPLNKKEVSRKEEDIVTVEDNALTVHETKLKVYIRISNFTHSTLVDICGQI